MVPPHQPLSHELIWTAAGPAKIHHTYWCAVQLCNVLLAVEMTRSKSGSTTLITSKWSKKPLDKKKCLSLMKDTMPGYSKISIYLSLSLSLSIYLSIYLPTYLSIYLPTYLSIYLSIYLSSYIQLNFQNMLSPFWVAACALLCPELLPIWTILCFNFISASFMATETAAFAATRLAARSCAPSAKTA